MKTNQNKTITVKSQKQYDVIIGNGLIDSLGEYALSISKAKKVAVITDDIVDKLYSQKAVESLQNAGFNVFKFVFNNGEKSKNIDTFYQIVRFLAQNEFTRQDLIIALGGGVVGDITGFSASAYLRGIKYIQVPTTLLAQIDSSVGGKTAIDIPEGKNLVGAFYQPSLVLADIDTLSSLPKQIYLDGMGEGVKYALLDSSIFDIVNADKLDLAEFVYACVKYKAYIVECDEFEGGKRKLLNLGHTIAHGIEGLSNFSISHGRAVGMGLKIITKASFKHNLISREEQDKILNLLDKLLGQDKCPYPIEEVLKIALVDKKRKGDFITLVMVNGIGNCIFIDVEVKRLAEYFL